MFLITFQRRSEHTIVIDAADEQAARQRFLNDSYYHGCDDCGSSLLEDDIIIDVGLA